MRDVHTFGNGELAFNLSENTAGELDGRPIIPRGRRRDEIERRIIVSADHRNLLRHPDSNL